eukprot:scaffold55094_cov57-Phaeocystis_antarctica.AAC.8
MLRGLLLLGEVDLLIVLVRGQPLAHLGQPRLNLALRVTNPNPSPNPNQPAAHFAESGALGAHAHAEHPVVLLACVGQEWGQS